MDGKPIEWELTEDQPCKYCGHLLKASHPLYLVSSRAQNLRRARCTECPCVLQNYT